MEMSIALNVRLNSVRTILFNNGKGSSSTEVLDIIRNAEAIFFAGSSHSDIDTPVFTVLMS
jgi:cyanophycinase-like exopeptidase